ncbi:protein ARK2N isoform X1 [Denticeps clupeoides]|uniref:E3 ubiquitin-protein ligase Arkadia N-terminal domain-containing protein n=1 Tax=Denticeps clupeoides TaxID=299321 RepID=A0AAY4A529_9TELE|nr:uncharacterized protein C18orf25 homolog isoform X1 [Denticeps clupeoides]
MRMANHEKDVETHPECTTEETTQRSETTPTSCPSGEEPAVTSESSAAGLLSMPCLLKELRPQAAPNSKLARPADDSDSSPCLLSPSSSGHLGDSDTQTSADEGTRVPGSAPGDPVPTGRKSRRSRSESDTPTAAMAAKKNRCQERQVNGRVRVRGQRSRLQKERMRMRRQKREAAARRKPDLLQDSSTSDSDITAHSSSSSSSSENENATGISSHIPAHRRRVESSGASSRGRGLLDEGGTNSSLGGVLEEALTRFAVMQRQTEERFRVWMDRLAHLHSDNDQSDSELAEGRGRDSSFLPSSESQETMAAYQMARLRSSPSHPIQTAAHNGSLDATDPSLLNV